MYENLLKNDIYVQDLNVALKNIKNIQRLRNKSILITGASGLIGSSMVDLLCEANRNMKMGIQIYAMGRNLDRLFRRFPYAKLYHNIHFIEHDIVQSLTKFFDIHFDYIIHAAGNASPQAIYTDPVGTIRANIDGTFNLLELLNHVKGKRLLFISSGEVYGQSSPDVLAFNEEYQGPITFLSVRSSYPLSKRTAENLCISYAKQYRLDTVIVRPCHIYGATILQSDNRAYAQFIRNAHHHQSIVLKSRGNQVRSYLYVADAVSSIFTALLNGKNGEAYNLANKRVCISIAELAQAIAEDADVQIRFEYHNDQPSPFSRAVLNCEKIEHLGWTAVFDLKTGIRHTLKIFNDIHNDYKNMNEN